MSAAGHIVALSGGVGGAKLATGLAKVLPERQLSIVANTGDDFEYLGMHISPDVDTLVYTLAGLNDPDRGWGRAAETWMFMSELPRLGVDTWFQIGDRDLATHVYRTSRLNAGWNLTEITGHLCERFGIDVEILPMSDDPVRTMLETDAGVLAFQEYFVRRKCEPSVSRISYRDAARSRPSPAVRDLLRDPGLGGIAICPSNPFLSIDPILSVPGIRDAIQCSPAPVVAVSPIIRGEAVKGPTAKLMRELGIPVSAPSVASHYGTLLDGFILDTRDASLASDIVETGTAVDVADTVMRSDGDRVALAKKVLELVGRLQKP